MTAGRPPAGRPVTILRETLAGPTTGPLAPFRPLALAIVREVLRTAPSVAEACRRLGIPRQSFDRLRESFPEIDQP